MGGSAPVWLEYDRTPKKTIGQSRSVIITVLSIALSPACSRLPSTRLPTFYCITPHLIFLSITKNMMLSSYIHICIIHVVYKLPSTFICLRLITLIPLWTDCTRVFVWPVHAVVQSTVLSSVFQYEDGPVICLTPTYFRQTYPHWRYGLTKWSRSCSSMADRFED